MSSINYSNSESSSILELNTIPNERRSSLIPSHYSLNLSLASPIFESNSELNAILINGLFDNRSLFSRSSPPNKSSNDVISNAVSSKDHTPMSISNNTFKIKLVLEPFDSKKSISLTTDGYEKVSLSKAFCSSDNLVKS